MCSLAFIEVTGWTLRYRICAGDSRRLGAVALVVSEWRGLTGMASWGCDTLPREAETEVNRILDGEEFLRLQNRDSIA